MHESPPPTPPPEAPRSKEFCRFNEIVDPCEWAENYRPGGFHPVQIGDMFKNGQYRILRKLGYGSYSTVWLARDQQRARYFAIKIAMSKQSGTADTELQICRHLAERSPTDPRSEHVLMTLDNFHLNGPNGTHICLIYEPMASTAASLAEKLPANYDGSVERRRYPKEIAKKILTDALTGLAFLHSNGVVHGDFQPGNLLFSANGLSSVEEKDLRQTIFTERLQRLDGKIDRWAPERLALPQSLHKFANLGPGMTIKISDFGASFWANQPPERTVTPLALRAPELIFNEPFGPPIDIWSFGCMIYEFLTGGQLFSVVMMGLDTQEEADDDHLLDLNDVIEPLPDSWLKKWPRASKWFGPNRERLNPYPLVPEDELSDINDEDELGPRDYANDMLEDIDHEDDLDPAEEANADDVSVEGRRAKHREVMDAESDTAPDTISFLEEGPWINDPLEILFAKNKPQGIDGGEAKVITDLIRRILKFDPLERPTAEELLEHPWFKC